MPYSLVAVIFVVIFFLSILLCLYLGRCYAIWQEKHSQDKKTHGVHVAEGAIFALLGLLVALTFVSVAQKFDQRRVLIIEEANAISTAYMRLDLFSDPNQTILKTELRKYLEDRLTAYKNIRKNIIKARGFIREAQGLETKIWATAIQECQTASAHHCMLVLPALNNVFDIANSRLISSEVHAHEFVFIFLIIVVLISALMAGASLSSHRLGSSLHIISFAFVMTITIYTIIDMEYPRLGLIHVDAFDHVLWELKDNLK